MQNCIEDDYRTIGEIGKRNRDSAEKLIENINLWSKFYQKLLILRIFQPFSA